MFLVDECKIANALIERRSVMGKSASVYKSSAPGCKTGYPEVDSELPESLDFGNLPESALNGVSLPQSPFFGDFAFDLCEA
jgi:hypothetical protein